MHIDFYLRFKTVRGQHLSIKCNLPHSGDKQTGLVQMKYFNPEFWKASIEIQPADTTFNYQYSLTYENGDVVKEGELGRLIDLKKLVGHISLIDTWNAAGTIENAFYTAPFKNIFLKDINQPKLKIAKTFTHIFKVKAPLLQPNECICILGSDEKLGAWNIEKSFLLEKGEEWHQLKIDLSGVGYPAGYKYGIYNFKRDAFVRFEDGENRIVFKTEDIKSITILHDGFARLPFKAWRGAGVAIPVFSLRSQNSFGVGEFADIKLLADWAALTGLKMIQLLPVNDTSATFTNQDSYPYAAISAFALHPVYINLEKVAGKRHAQSIKSLQKKGRQLNALTEVNYQQVIYYKMNTLRELYDLQGDEFLKEDGYKTFFATNGHWLKPYAAFCLLRDRNNTADFRTWKTHGIYNGEETEKLTARKSKTAREVRFYYFVQYHLHLQLKEAADYTHKKGVALKGDIPIGIFRNSVDAWTAPGLYNMEEQAGAPPDDFAIKGQNWGFPTYNWQRMQEDGFEWWKGRFKQMNEYFDAFRIDHILGFFRIWSIPLNAVEGIIGRFVPAVAVNISEFYQKNIRFDYDRYCKPFINTAILQDAFSSRSTYVIETFLECLDDNRYRFKKSFNTQRKIEAYFQDEANPDENETIKKGLFNLISNVILFEEAGSAGLQFHFRISAEQTTSFQDLDSATKHALYELYIDYFYRRQDGFWKREALKKLPYLKEATNMLVCGEDLGMVPHSVAGVMSDLGILSLEVQRMPKNPGQRFLHPKDAPYLSVITPSTHDMSTVRAWWEEDRLRTQEFYNTILESPGEAPYFCEPWINRAIVLQHLYSPAMWSIFQLQDLLGMGETLRREDPLEERINVPADPKHYWCYRMHISLEDLLKETEFNAEVKDYITNSGRD